jgi:hypothetical protein
MLCAAYTDVVGEQRTATYIHIEKGKGRVDVTGTAHKPDDGPLQKWGSCTRWSVVTAASSSRSRVDTAR